MRFRTPQNVNVTDQSGQTALSHACKQGNLEVVHQLLAAGSLRQVESRQVGSRQVESRQVGSRQVG